MKKLESEHKVLIDIFKALDGVNWNIKDNWCSDKPISEWFGITINKNGKVVALSLTANNLTGTIPHSIGRLKYLKHLNLSRNNIRGFIPKEIGMLVSLVDLHLGDNKFTGSIPSEIGNLKHLSHLTLNNNKFTGIIPDEIGMLTKLRSVDLSNNKLSGAIPAKFSNLTILKELFLNYNSLSDFIPAEFGELKQLKYLLLNNNKLTGSIPPEIGKMAKLSMLQLSDNNLTGAIPEEIGNLTKLNSLLLDNNKLTGKLPAGLMRLARLKYLSVTNNQLTDDLPTRLMQLPKLEKLNLYNNQLTGEVLEKWKKIPIFKTGWGNIIAGNNFYLESSSLEAPLFHVTSYNKGHIKLNADEIYAKHRYTILHQSQNGVIDKKLLKLFKQYTNSEIEIVSYTSYYKAAERMALTLLNNPAEDGEVMWCVVHSTENNSILGNELPYQNWYPSVTEKIESIYTIVDKTGKIVYIDSNIDNIAVYIDVYLTL